MKPSLCAASFIVCLALNACVEPTADYLLEHPAELFKAEANCQSMRTGINGSSAQCKMVMSAALAFHSLDEAETADPLGFGKRVIAAQNALVDAQTALESARQALADLKRTNLSADSVKTAQEKVAAAKTEYASKLREVNILLAVISLRSPD